MRLTVNGEARVVADAETVDGLVRAVAGDERGVAVAVDGEVVPRSAWSATSLSEGQAVEVLKAVQGG